MLLLKNINWINKDKKKRLLFLKKEWKKITLKSLIYSNSHKFFNKIYFDKKFKSFSHSYSISRFRNSCMFLGNSRAVMYSFKLSRHACKKYSASGFIVGLRKASF